MPEQKQRNWVGRQSPESDENAGQEPFDFAKLTRVPDSNFTLRDLRHNRL